ncbi:MAG: MFS transporter [Propionibacteriales bacterium]|nr:MFS transporter [Propionibacteriales bacterium]
MFSSYRHVLSRPGALAFTSAAFVGRLPIAMVGLGIVLMVEHHTGSYGLAGSVSATYVVANAVTAPVLARLVDRRGQRRVLPLAIGGYGAALALLMWAVPQGAPIVVAFVLAALTGGAMPPIGSSVRARWTHLLRGRPELQTAYAIEGVVDEVIFMVGPVVVIALATTVTPVVGLAAPLVLGVGGTVLLAAQRATEPPVDPRDPRVTTRSPLGWRLLLPLIVACVALGSLFGSAEVVTIAFTDEAGRPGTAAVLLAVWALGSLLAGLVTGAVTWRAAPLHRFKLGALALAVTMSPLPFVDSIPVLGLVLFVAGFAIAPTMIASIGAVQATVPPARLTEGIAWVTTGLTAGVAPGAALAGRVVDVSGASAAFWVSAVSGLVAAALALATRTRQPGLGVAAARG